MNHSPDVSLLLPALLSSQQGFPPIPKSQHVQVTSRTGRSYAYDFAPLDEILAAVMPVLAAHGLLITSASVPSEGGMCVATRLWHVSGQYLESLVPAGAYEDCKGQGSAISYARRFSHLSLLNLAGQDDEDGSLSNGDHIEPRQKPEKLRPSVPVNGNGHTPAPEQPKGVPKNLVQKSDLLHQIQDEITRIGRPVGEVTVLYQAAFGAEITSWDLVCGESLHTLKHGLTYLKTLFQTEAPDEPQAPREPAPAPAATTAEVRPTGADFNSDPLPKAAPGPSGAVAPEPDAAERDRVRLREEVKSWDLRVPPEEVEHVIQHNPYSRARQLLWKCRRQEAAA